MLRPLPGERWSYAAAAHLLNRAGFGGPPVDIERLEALGREGAVSHLLDYERVPDPTPDPVWAKPDPDRVERFRQMRMAAPEERRKLQREEQQSQRQRLLELRGWWLARMAKGPRPLQEKMVLFWHGHFATSFEKVRDAYLMWRQNELFRRLATGNWLRLLVEAGKDPAMLVWLDQAQSRKEHPNENFAREVMELFALGEGHYTEKDVTEGARALTGWSYDRLNQKFIDRPYWHDTGAKTIFGKTGNFGGEDFLGLIVAHPQAARFITSRLWEYFAGAEPSEALNEALAAVMRSSQNELKPVLRVLFSSEEFYAPEVVRNQVKSPVQWLVSSVRLLERELPPPLVCSALTRNLGQDLFAPPNVKGWDGGLSWITTNTLLARYNQAGTLVYGELGPLAATPIGPKPVRNPQLQRRLQNARLPAVAPENLFTEPERNNNEALLAALEKRFLQTQLSTRQRQALRDYLDRELASGEARLLNAICLTMSTPEYQLA